LVSLEEICWIASTTCGRLRKVFLSAASAVGNSSLAIQTFVVEEKCVVSTCLADRRYFDIGLVAFSTFSNSVITQNTKILEFVVVCLALIAYIFLGLAEGTKLISAVSSCDDEILNGELFCLGREKQDEEERQELNLH
jgi:hypothetical protein